MCCLAFALFSVLLCAIINYQNKYSITLCRADNPVIVEWIHGGVLWGIVGYCKILHWD